jgi:hypothetical protein
VPLDVHLSSALGAKQVARLSLRGGGLDLSQAFPEPGRLTTFSLNIATPMIEELVVGFGVDDKSLEVIIQKLPTTGSMSLLALPNNAFLGSVYHAPTAKGCIVKCSDGSEGQDCAFCTRNGITVKICC